MKSLPSRRFSRFGVSRSAGRSGSTAAAQSEGGADTTVSASQSEVTSSPANILNNGTATSTVTVTLRNASGTPLSGKTVTLSSTGSNNTIVQPGTTNGSGVATGTIASTTAEAKTITAVAEGITVTDTATVTAQTTTLVFASQWDSATGDSSAAVQDTSASTPWEIRVGGVGNGASVVNAASDGVDTGCPTTNALRVDLVYIGGAVQNMDTDEVMMLPLSGAWSTPAIGESVYERVYKRVVYPHVADPGTLGNNNHCVEQSSGSANSWSWNFHTASGGWNPSFNVWVAGTPERFLLGGASPIYLSRDVWYRMEWRTNRTDTNLREHEIRLYNAAGTLIYDETDFATSSGTNLSGYSAAFGTNGVAGMDAFALGTNGPHVVGATAGASPAWYFAAAAVSVSDWCGPYTSGEAP